MVHFQLRINKFYTFTASSLIQVVGSPVYTFSIYATALGDALGLDQGQVQGLGSSMTFGLFLAIISGSAYDLLEHHKRMGPRITVWVGSALAAIGYGGLFLASTGRLAVSYAGLLAFAFIAGNSSSWFDTATIVTNVRNFPNNRGTVVGLLKTFVGLSGSIYSSVYVSSLAPDGTAYIGMLAVTSSLLPLLLSLGVNHVPYVELAEVHSFTSWFNPEARFLLAYVTVVVLALYQMTSALLEGIGELPLPGTAGDDLLSFNSLGMFGILSVILLVPWNSGGLASRYVHEHLCNLEAGPSSLPRWWQLLQLVDSNEEPILGPRRLDIVGKSSRLTSAQGQPAAQPHGEEIGAVHIGRQVTMSSGDQHNLTLAEIDEELRDDGSSFAVTPRRWSDWSNLNLSLIAGGLQEPLLPQQQQQKSGGGSGEGQQGIAGVLGRSTSVTPVNVECQHRFTNLSLSQATRTVQFWLLFYIFVAGVGSCLTFLNNLGQLTVALGGAAGSHVAFVSTYAVGNAAGRIFMGQIPENYLHVHGTPRTKWLVAVITCLTATVLSAAAASRPVHLHILAPALGACYGGMFTLIPAIAADIFGLRHFAANYAGLQTACAIGSYVFPTQLAGWFYQKAAMHHEDEGMCIGRDCFGPAFVVEGLVCLVAAICAGVVYGTTCSVYQQLAQHLHEVQEEEEQDMIEQWQVEHHNKLSRTCRTQSDPGLTSYRHYSLPAYIGRSRSTGSRGTVAGSAPAGADESLAAEDLEPLPLRRKPTL